MPLVSIGMPVKNGEEGLSKALENILSQPYRNIEVIVSDNGSTDATWEICQKAASSDSRVRVVRQEFPISGPDNFNYVIDAASGKYFFWAAHDDYRSMDYISSAVDFLERNKNAVLAYGKTVLCYPNGDVVDYSFDFETVSRGKVARVWKTAQIQYYHVYGVWRKEALEGIRFDNCPFWSDMPMMVASAVRGEFAFVDGPVFYRGERIKSNEEIIRNVFGISARETGRTKLMLQLLSAMYKRMRDVGGGALAVLSCAFVLVRFFRQSLNFRERRIRRKMAQQGWG